MKHLANAIELKARVRQGGALTVEDAQDVLSKKEAEEQARRDKRSDEGFQKEGQPSRRRCSTCAKSGHNARTCQEAIILLVYQIPSSSN
jgi:hypothetical protein